MRRVAAFGALSFFFVGCLPALREPRSVNDLQRQSVSGSGNAKQLLAEAEQDFARRPDVAAVRRAEGLFLRAAAADERDVEGLLGAIRAKAWLIEHDTESERREELAVSAVEAAQWCLRRAPDNLACSYWLALAIGLQAREKRQTADDGLKRMIELLKQVATKDPNLDDAGPERVLALVLLRAPSWPLGPGDAEAGLEEARKAVALRPDYPPNQLVLAEAFHANSQLEPAGAAYGRALEEAQKLRAAGNPDAADWIKEASPHVQ
jgi:tetratricopeptide (TPR) repeat protein